MTRTRPRSAPATLLAVLIAGTGAAVGALPATGQDALGTGNALDRNLRVGSGGINAPVRQEDFYARNLIVTRNVMGGRGFRESVGYGAAEDFRAATGSDDLFLERANSAISNINFINYGNTYERLRFGQSAGIIEYRRTGEAVGMRDVERGVWSPNEVVEARLQLDRLSFATETANATRLAVEPVPIGGFVREDGSRVIVETSPFAGLAERPADQYTQMLGLNMLDHARVTQDLIAGRGTDRGPVGEPWVTRYEDLLSPPGTERGTEPRIGAEDDALPSEPARRMPSGVRDANSRLVPEAVPTRENDFRRIREKIAARYAAVEAEEEAAPVDLYHQIEEDLRLLRERLEAGTPAGPDESPEPPADGSAPPDEPGTEDSGAAPTGPTPIEDFGVILRHGQRVEHFASLDQTRFHELMASGEERLRDGEYFWAERHFTRALRFTPGHPLATAGLAHAQVGAGLYLSAALTLRSLFVHQPEMIDATYAESLVPTRQRLLHAVEALQRQIENSTDRDAYALLLAYVGRLLDDRAVIEQGLTRMAIEAPDDPMAPLLRSVWLDGQPALLRESR